MYIFIYELVFISTLKILLVIYKFLIIITRSNFGCVRFHPNDAMLVIKLVSRSVPQHTHLCYAKHRCNNMEFFNLYNHIFFIGPWKSLAKLHFPYDHNLYNHMFFYIELRKQNNRISTIVSFKMSFVIIQICNNHNFNVHVSQLPQGFLCKLIKQCRNNHSVYLFACTFSILTMQVLEKYTQIFHHFSTLVSNKQRL